MAHEFNTFEDLERYLRNFQTWDQRGGYDFGGIVHLLGACLDNLREYSRDEEFEDLAEFLDPDQRAYLRHLAKFAR